MSVGDYSAEAKHIIAKAIENAIKHFTVKLEGEVVGEDESNKMADYWPLGSQANEQTGLLAIEAFIKVPYAIYGVVPFIIERPTFPYRSGAEVVNGNILSNIWARLRINYILRFDGVFQQDVSQYPEQPPQYILHCGYIIW